ncbi:hypothetical protein SLS62_009839 [Diatrype stigma]|uniref:Uncharacterized protein n=1 Tax=Diatrype stigma TaxID=117547 RepID=A0AAN9UF16_9PEZI
MSASTPNKPLTQPVQDSPGTWRHPRLAEINRRQERTTFSEKNVRRIAVNICALAILAALKLLLAEVLPSKQLIPKRITEQPAASQSDERRETLIYQLPRLAHSGESWRIAIWSRQSKPDPSERQEEQYRAE